MNGVENLERRKLQLLKQYVGEELLVYMLNCEENTLNQIMSGEFDLNENQLHVLNELYKVIKDIRIQYVESDGYGDGTSDRLRTLYDKNFNLYNDYRRICGGEIINYYSGDPLLDFIVEITIKVYPSLLLKSSLDRSSFNTAIKLTLSEHDTFISLVKNDVVDRLTNHGENLEYSFDFKTTDGLEFKHQIVTAFPSMIARAFQNCCNKMNYSIESVINEIEDYIDKLRLLANGESINYSSFVGLKHLRLLDTDEIDLGRAIIRQIDSVSNPGLYIGSTISLHSSNTERFYSGCILEILHSVEVSSEKPTTNCSGSREYNQKQLFVLDCFNLAVVFTLLQHRSTATSFFECGFPLVSTGNSSHSLSKPSDYTIIREEDHEELLEWFTILVNSEHKTLTIPLQRLKYAIFERYSAEDSIVDAIIAWEGMLSGATETSFKVTGSIANLLAESDSRKEFYRRLKKLYGLRSDFVHGNENRLIKSGEDIWQLREEVILIGLKCMKIILSDAELLKLKPSERVNEILIMKSIQ